MEKDILELEKILEQEIEACENLEKQLTDKKESLIKGDIDAMLRADTELEKYNSAIEKLEEERKKLYPEHSALSDIIENIEDKNSADNLSGMREKFLSKLETVRHKNNLNEELIRHSLKIVDSSINSIINMFVPENSSYNHKGLFEGESTQAISSVVHEA